MTLAKAHTGPGGLAESPRFDDFKVLVERYQSLVWAVAYATTGDQGLSEDVAQETFLALWKQQADIRDPAKIKGYLATIARNLGRKAIRGSRWKFEQGDTGTEAVDTRNPLDDVLEREQQSQVALALTQMPSSSREAFVLFYAEGESLAAVAADLALSQSAVKQRLYRARESLKESLHETLSEAVIVGNPGKAMVVATMALILGQGGAAAAQATLGHASAAGAAKGQGLATSVASVSGKSAAGLVLVAAAALVFFARAGESERKPGDGAEAVSAERGASAPASSIAPTFAMPAGRVEHGRVIAAAQGAPVQLEIAGRILESLPAADLDGDGRLSEDEVLVLRNAQEDELSKQIFEHWQDKPYGVTCAFFGQADDGQLEEGFTPYNLYGMRARYEEELSAGLDMDAEQWISSKVATAQEERICYEIAARYHDEVHELRANAKDRPLSWVASVTFEGQEALLFPPPRELREDLARVSDQAEADKVAHRWGVQLLVRADASSQTQGHDQDYVAVSRDPSKLADWDQLPLVIQVAIQAAGQVGQAN